eukprot:gene35976-52129_t
MDTTNVGDRRRASPDRHRPTVHDCGTATMDCTTLNYIQSAHTAPGCNTSKGQDTTCCTLWLPIPAMRALCGFSRCCATRFRDDFCRAASPRRAQREGGWRSRLPPRGEGGAEWFGAASGGDVATLRRLLRKGDPCPTPGGGSPLLAAVELAPHTPAGGVHVASARELAEAAGHAHVAALLMEQPPSGRDRHASPTEGGRLPAANQKDVFAFAVPQ